MEQYGNTASAEMSTGKDAQLWEIAKRRVGFKYNLASYIIVNTFFWVLWYLTGRHEARTGFPWPVWPMFGWGIGLFFHYLGAYVYPKNNSVEKEYERLVSKRN